MDSLEISGLNVACRIGVHEWEQAITQSLLIDIVIPVDLKTCKDTLAETIDYSELCQSVTDFVESKRFNLIETVANEVALLLKEKYHLNKVYTAVSKPHAVKSATNVKVVVNR